MILQFGDDAAVSTILTIDDAANNFDFQANNLTTTGTITGGTADFNGSLTI